MAFTHDERMYVGDLHSYTEGITKEAVALFNQTFQDIRDGPKYKHLENMVGFSITECSVRKIWGSYGFNSNNHGGSRYGLSDDQLRELHLRHGGNFQRMLVDYRHSAQTLKYRCRGLSLEVHNVPPERGNGPVHRYKFAGVHRSRRGTPKHS